MKEKDGVLSFLAEEAAYYFGRLNLTQEERPAVQAEVREELFAVDDPERDDAFRLELAGGKLLIQGSNPRSCLIAFYRFLYELGLRFPRPGRRYEHIPEELKLPAELRLEEKASYRHRGVCIEGADSVGNVLDFIDWLPKIYCNSFFLQFFYPYDFLKKWYHHLNNPLIRPEKYELAEHLPHNQAMAEAMTKRGILHQRVGHGWTAKALGYDGLGWDKTEDNEAIEAHRERAAEIKGERGLFYGRPLMTNLCLANKEAREAFASSVADYAEEHPEVDVLHVWLADSLNSVCECEKCRKTTPADQYVLLLNETDALLTKRGIKTKICFLIYLDLLWPPLKNKLENPDRFILMYAPITRTFEKSLAAAAYPPELPLKPYVRNKLVLPVSVEENLTFLHAWQERQKTDSFIYDYPLGRAHYGDLGYMKIARVIAEDTAQLERLGLNGYISCQELRTALPSALPDYMLGHKLWQKKTPAEPLIDDYFRSCYGTFGREVKKALEALSSLSNTDYVNGKMPPEQPAFAADFAEGEKKALQLEEDLEAELSRRHTPQERLYLDELRYYAGYAKRFFRALSLRAGKDVPEEELQEAWREVCLYLQRSEQNYQAGFDVYRLIEVASHFTKMPSYPEPFPGYDEQMTMRKLE